MPDDTYQTFKMVEVAAIKCLTGKDYDETVVVNNHRGQPWVIAKYGNREDLPSPETLEIVGIVNGEEVRAPLLYNPESEKQDFDNVLFKIKKEFLGQADQRRQNADETHRAD